MKKNHEHKYLFILNMVLGIFLVTVLPVYLYVTGIIRNNLVLIVAFSMGVSSLLHHLSILHHLQPWRGVITPPRLRVPLVHGAISHLLFSISYIIYGFLLLFSYLSLTSLITEKLVLILFVVYIELVAVIVGFDGLRMCYIRKL